MGSRWRDAGPSGREGGAVGAEDEKEDKMLVKKRLTLSINLSGSCSRCDVQAPLHQPLRHASSRDTSPFLSINVVMKLTLATGSPAPRC